MAVFRQAPVFFKGKKIAEIESAKYNIATNREAQIGAEGYMGHSKGPIITKISANCVIPVSGMTSRITTALLTGESVTIGIAVDGQLHQIDMTATTADFDTDTKSGNLKGSFEFEGGQPEVTG